MCILIADSCCCRAETNIIILQVKKLKKKKKAVIRACVGLRGGEIDSTINQDEIRF